MRHALLIVLTFSSHLVTQVLQAISNAMRMSPYCCNLCVPCSTIATTWEPSPTDVEILCLWDRMSNSIYCYHLHMLWSRKCTGSLSVCREVVEAFWQHWIQLFNSILIPYALCNMPTHAQHLLTLFHNPFISTIRFRCIHCRLYSIPSYFCVILYPTIYYFETLHIWWVETLSVSTH